jgi:biopolymer transport protein ExbD
MRAVRRHDLSPRIEIMPLIDVIFLLLTFFIYSMVTMVRAEILPVQLQTLTTGQAAEPTAILAITIDARGELYLNRAPITPDELDKKLNEVADLEDPPKLFLALEDTPAIGGGGAMVDRGPLLIGLIERVRRAGLEDFNIVGDRVTP